MLPSAPCPGALTNPSGREDNIVALASPEPQRLALFDPLGGTDSDGGKHCPRQRSIAETAETESDGRRTSGVSIGGGGDERVNRFMLLQKTQD